MTVQRNCLPVSLYEINYAVKVCSYSENNRTSVSTHHQISLELLLVYLGEGGNTRMENVILVIIAILYLGKQTGMNVQV